MAALSESIGDAIVTLLNAGSFTQTVTAVRTYIPAYINNTLEGIRLEVIPATLETQSNDREQFTGLYTFYIVTSSDKCQSTNKTKIDDLNEYVEELQDYLFDETKRLLSTGHGLAKVPEVLVHFDIDELYEKSVFFSVFSITYRASRGQA